MEDRGGRLELLLPYATLEPVRELLLQMFMGEKFGRDTIWEAPPGAGAVVHRGRADRRCWTNARCRWTRCSTLQVGSRIMFAATADSSVRMSCAGVADVHGEDGPARQPHRRADRRSHRPNKRGALSRAVEPRPRPAGRRAAGRLHRRHPHSRPPPHRPARRQQRAGEADAQLPGSDRPRRPRGAAD